MSNHRRGPKINYIHITDRMGSTYKHKTNILCKHRPSTKSRTLPPPKTGFGKCKANNLLFFYPHLDSLANTNMPREWEKALSRFLSAEVAAPPPTPTPPPDDVHTQRLLYSCVTHTHTCTTGVPDTFSSIAIIIQNFCWNIKILMTN